MIELIQDIGVGSVSVKLQSNGLISKWCKVVTRQVDSDLVAEVRARSRLNSSEILMWEVSM